MKSNGKVKDFDGWIRLKKRMDKPRKPPTFNDGEVWWCGVGENVGVEICGKGQRFSRPVVILKKLNKNCFFGVPLTTKKKNSSFYVPFVFHDTSETAVLCQIRVMSAFRLYDLMGTLPESDLENIKVNFRGLFM